MVKMAPLGVAARSAAFSPDGELLAVGLKNGAFVVLKTADLKIVAQKRDRHQAIQDVRYLGTIIRFSSQLLGLTLRWTHIPSKGRTNARSCFTLQK